MTSQKFIYISQQCKLWQKFTKENDYNSMSNCTNVKMCMVSVQNKLNLKLIIDMSFWG